MIHEEENINTENDMPLEKVNVWRQIAEDTANMLGIRNLIDYPKEVKKAVFAVFVISVMVFHIYNSHKAVRMVREKDLLEKKIKEIKWELISVQSDLLKRSIQTDIETHTDAIGLKQIKTPPYKITVAKDEN